MWGRNSNLIGSVTAKLAQGTRLKYQYCDKEKALLKKIQVNISEQNDLAQQSRELNKKMSQLYSEITLLKESYNDNLTHLKQTKAV